MSGQDITVQYETFGDGRSVIILRGSNDDHTHLKPSLETIFAGRDGWKRVYPDLSRAGKTSAKDWITSNDQLNFPF
jgi:hypothetical protein